MSKKYVLAFDPGVSSGVALASYSDSDPFDLVEVWQFGDGIKGLLFWLRCHIWDNYPDAGESLREGETLIDLDLIDIVCEKFTPRTALTLKGSIPLVGEGVLIGRGLMPPYDPQIDAWQAPARQYSTFGGTDLADKKKVARRRLKEFGWYRLPRELGTPDSDDAMSATLHALSFVMHTVKHKPTFDLISQKV